MTCQKHKETPAWGYSPCAGCEVEWQRDEINKLKEENKSLKNKIQKLNDYIYETFEMEGY